MSLLAVDLGLKTGLALFSKEGKLQWYRSRNFGTKARLRKAAASVIKEAGTVEVLVIEGGGTMENSLDRRGQAKRNCSVAIACTCLAKTSFTLPPSEKRPRSQEAC